MMDSIPSIRMKADSFRTFLVHSKPEIAIFLEHFRKIAEAAFRRVSRLSIAKGFGCVVFYIIVKPQ